MGSDAIIVGQENLSLVICAIPRGADWSHRRWIQKKKGKWDTFFPRTLKNSMHPWVYSSSRYAGRGKLDKIIPPLQIKEQSSWNSWLRKEREISHISYFPLPSFAFMRLVHVAIHLHDASKIDENAGNISERRFQAGGDIKPVYVGAFWKWSV